MLSDILKNLSRIFKINNTDEAMQMYSDLREEQLKSYSTKELIKELKTRGINMPKKYK
ncbi:hypothetical protein [Clostridium cagae]|uniref:hypothetical protein n=1 Tax=Clostridium cagae TaxID=2080751 RepID=UPI001319BF02|nr:hypothetical protein [Clostridium cagae]